ncbi:peptide/nickel transport system ATP-binding protein [Brachybacterium muris]|uniref:ABC transporter ATP-binding protein n=1 Tax=Brachybacterium muris TaxID=219301 RepID=UPI0019595F41|nr:ABC transporter ATP-binding protein [Brachybacterium muris]MBM7502286.1 peptide/nickel transport system ATP-binding protein [Brachybacterium muris]MCT2295385.1 ABC transporter ATP-binding protein [Brachybacterium muris]
MSVPVANTPPPPHDADRTDVTEGTPVQDEPVLTVEGLSIRYEVSPPVDAVQDASFVLRRGEILGLAGESGCGKTTLAYGLNQLHRPPARIIGGSVTFHDQDSTQDIDVLSLEGDSLRSFRWSKIAMVFQGAMNSLNPVLSVRTQLNDVFTTHRPGMAAEERRRRSEDLLELVGVDRTRIGAFPHELSGGMRQRVMIAMALALDPQLMIMDEPTTALDVVVQREILQEILRLRQELGFAVVFITHDLPMLLEIADRIAVMKDGRIVELATAEDLYFEPRSPYTRKLLGSFPSLTGEAGDFIRAGFSQEEAR